MHNSLATSEQMAEQILHGVLARRQNDSAERLREQSAILRAAVASALNDIDEAAAAKAGTIQAWPS